MFISSIISKILVISRKKEDVHLYSNCEELEIVGGFTYLETVVRNTATIDIEVSRRIGKANIIYYQICNAIVGMIEVTYQFKLHIFKAFLLPTLLYGSES